MVGGSFGSTGPSGEEDDLYGPVCQDTVGAPPRSPAATHHATRCREELSPFGEPAPGLDTLRGTVYLSPWLSGADRVDSAEAPGGASPPAGWLSTKLATGATDCCAPFRSHPEPVSPARSAESLSPLGRCSGSGVVMRSSLLPRGYGTRVLRSRNKDLICPPTALDSPQARGRSDIEEDHPANYLRRRLHWSEDHRRGQFLPSVDELLVEDPLPLPVPTFFEFTVFDVDLTHPDRGPRPSVELHPEDPDGLDDRPHSQYDPGGCQVSGSRHRHACPPPIQKSQHASSNYTESTDSCPNPS
jgi:hypothetical protein